MQMIVLFSCMVSQNTVELTRSDKIFLWIRRNRGVCSKIARDHEVTPGFVRQILYSPEVKSTSLRIERALHDAGAPFMDERIKAFQ